MYDPIESFAGLVGVDGGVTARIKDSWCVHSFHSWYPGGGQGVENDL